MAEKFDAVIDKIVANTEKKMLAVVKNSIQEIVQEAQTPVAKGGKMRVDTGFLRHSGTAQLNALPKGLTQGRKREDDEVGVLPEYKTDDKAGYISETLIKMKIGDTFYFGWTAKYAQIREIYDGFMESAVEKWQDIVNRQIKRLRK